MAETARPGDTQEGIAGYVSPYPYVERLQEKMEERLDRRVPAGGRFCGFCYGRLRAEEALCPFCGTATAARETVDEIPQEVLRAYLVKRKTEGRWVHTGAMVGLLLASLLFLVLIAWGPGLVGHPAVALAALIGGGYLLAQLFGTYLGAQIGYRKGARKRDAMWGAWVAKRDEDLGLGG